MENTSPLADTNADTASCFEFMSRSTSESNLRTPRTPPKHGMSGMELKQLSQMLEKGVDEQGCAAVLNVDVSIVRQLKDEMAPDSPQKPDRRLAGREEIQLRTLFARQLSPRACSEILHIDVDVVNEFKASEDAAKRSILQKAGPLIVHAAGVTAAYTRSFAGAASNLTKNKTFRVSTASAGAGTVVGAVAGGTTGTVVGGVVGATAGTVPAFFTFGLSIPFFATVGGGMGLCIGTVSGATVGAVAGGATGYAGHTYSKEIRSMTAKTLEKSRCAAQMIRGHVAGLQQKLKSGEHHVDDEHHVAVAG